MVIDSSAIIAILLGEPDAELVARALLADRARRMSAFSALEASIVIEARKGAAGGREWELLAYRTGIEFIPFTAAQQLLALEGWRRYGKGQHKASLNIGDCCTYALWAHIREPILCKGEDFSRTDAELVDWRISL